MITVRLFAAAADAAGVDECTFDPREAVQIGEVREALGARFGGEMRRVLERCSMLVNSVRADDGHAVAAGDTVDVLPPFAGG